MPGMCVQSPECKYTPLSGCSPLSGHSTPSPQMTRDPHRLLGREDGGPLSRQPKERASPCEECFFFVFCSLDQAYFRVVVRARLENYNGESRVQRSALKVERLDFAEAARRLVALTKELVRKKQVAETKEPSLLDGCSLRLSAFFRSFSSACAESLLRVSGVAFV